MTNYQTMSPIFDYRALRLLVGIIAVLLPFVVYAIAKISEVDLTSISAAYYGIR